MMPRRLGTVGLVVRIAVRGLFASRLKTVIVGGIVAGGAGLVVVVSSLVHSVDSGMRGSIIDSLAGHAQIVNAESPEDLAIYGGVTGQSDVRPLEDFAKVKAVVLGVPNVRHLVPLAVSEGMLGGGANPLERELGRLRRLWRELGQGAPAQAEAGRMAYVASKEHVRRTLELMHRSSSVVAERLAEEAVDPGASAALERARGEAFWRDFDDHPEAHLEFLEDQVAPHLLEGDYLTRLRFVGTDLEAFRRAFPRFEVVEGELVPPGRRGIVLAQLYREDALKLRVAWRLDRLEEARVAGRRIAGDETLERYVRENLSQTQEILAQLDATGEHELVRRLRRALRSDEGQPDALLKQLLSVDDESLSERYRLFYSEVAPLVRLYRIEVGETMVINAMTHVGTMKSIDVKVYGVYRFKGWERSQFAGELSLMDLLSFRELYGYPSAEDAAEATAIRAQVGLRSIAREEAVAELFGRQDEAPAVAPAPERVDPVGGLSGRGREDPQGRVHGQEEIDHGVVLSAAVLVEDPRRLDETTAAIERAGREAGLPLKVLGWQRVTGVVGQFVGFSRVILYASLAVILVVALIISSNAMVMATLRRVPEFGTLRAIGAQRRLVLSILLVESLVVGVVFGALGAGFGVGVIQALRVVGITARSEEMLFLFSGPRLHPTLAGASLAAALLCVVVVSVASAFYPAVLAMRVSPLEAMRTEE